MTDAPPMIERALAAWVDFARRFAWAVVVAALVATGGLLHYTATNLGMNTSTADMLDPALEFRRQMTRFDAAFPQLSDSMLIVIDGETLDAAEDAAEAIAARLDGADAFEWVYQPGADPFFIRNGLLYLEADELESLADRLADAQPLLADIDRDPSMRGLFGVLELAAEEIADGDEVPAGLARVLDEISATIESTGRAVLRRLPWSEVMQGEAAEPGDRRRFVLARPRLDYATLQPAGAAIRSVRAAARELGYDRPEAGVRVRLSGSTVLRHEELESVKDGAGLAGIISLVLVAVLLMLGLRSPRLVFAALVTLLAGLVWTAAFATFAVGALNLISVAFAVLFIGLAVDFGIHFCLRYLEAVGDGARTPAALEAAARGVGGALLLSAVAAGIGFLSFLPTAFIGVAELGLISAAGMVFAFLANVTLLPALLALLPVKAHARAPSNLAGAAESLFERLARPIVWGALVLGLASLAAIPLARFDVDPFNLRDPSTESVQTILALEREQGRPAYTIDILAPDLAAADRLAERLEELAEVDAAVTLSDLVPADQDEKLDIIDEMTLFLTSVLAPPERIAPPSDAERRAAGMRLSEKLAALDGRPAGAQFAASVRRLGQALHGLQAEDATRLAALETALVGGLPKRLDKLRLSLSADYVTLDDLPPDFAGRYLAADGRARIEVEPEADIRRREALEAYVGAVRALAPEATSTPVVIVEAAHAVVRAFQEATVIAVMAITLLLLIVLRNLRDVLYVLAPLALAAALTVATTVVAGLQFNFANVIVLPLLLGLGVASGIHLVLRHRRDGRGRSLLASSTPRAVLFSALTTMGSFGSLAISSHRGTASMGLLLTIALSYSLVCFLIVLPAMFAHRRGRQTGGA